MSNGLFTPVDVTNLEKGAIQSRSYIWNTGTLAWEAATGSLTGGGTVTVNNFPATQAISAASLPLPSGAALDASILAELASYKITDDDSIPNPSYFGYTNAEGITLTMDGEDFRIALLKEIGPVAMVFKQVTFESMVNKAFENVIEGIKEESAKIV